MRQALSQGETAAARTFQLPMPKDATKEQRALADEALGYVLDVARQDWRSKGSGEKLKAAIAMRALAGVPVPTRVEATGANGEELKVVVTRQAPDLLGDDDEDQPALPERGNAWRR